MCYIKRLLITLIWYYTNYPEDGDVTAEVKVWEIHYPLDIKSNPKYLATEPPKKQGD